MDLCYIVNFLKDEALTVLPIVLLSAYNICYIAEFKNVFDSILKVHYEKWN